MKKIVCPHCGTVNLEKFVTYPHCAGCSALLAAQVSPRVLWWRRRVRTGWWAAVLGVTILLLVALALNETDVRQNGPVVVYPQLSRTMKMGETLDCRLVFDAVRDNGTSPQHLENLQLRFGRKFEKQWQIIDITPVPNRDQLGVAGRTLQYKSWPINTAWRVQLRPRQVGRPKIMIAVDAKDFLPMQYSATVEVVAATTKKPRGNAAIELK